MVNASTTPEMPKCDDAVSELHKGYSFEAGWMIAIHKMRANIILKPLQKFQVSLDHATLVCGEWPGLLSGDGGGDRQIIRNN